MNAKISLATSTQYENWTPDTLPRNATGISDKVRGDLALETIREAVRKEFFVSVVDGASSAQFKAELAHIQQSSNGLVTIAPQTGDTTNSARREAFEMAFQKVPENGIICWLEPEKVSVVKDCLPFALEPILDGTADIIIPKRTEDSFATYPEYQTVSEQHANREFNALLKKYSLITGDTEYDFWFGPRFFINSPLVRSLFIQTYNHDDTEQWTNTLFLPVVKALQQHKRVVSEEVMYTHPTIQTAIEEHSEVMEAKRDTQRNRIILATSQFLQRS